MVFFILIFLDFVWRWENLRGDDCHSGTHDLYSGAPVPRSARYQFSTQFLSPVIGPMGLISGFFPLDLVYAAFCLFFGGAMEFGKGKGEGKRGGIVVGIYPGGETSGPAVRSPFFQPFFLLVCWEIRGFHGFGLFEGVHLEDLVLGFDLGICTLYAFGSLEELGLRVKVR